MCSICGYFSHNKIPTSTVIDMLSRMEHRGPDACGLYADGEILKKNSVGQLTNNKRAHICIGHSRLSIMGKDDSIQPFTSCDGTLSLVYNGEIYNQNELQELLGSHHDIKDRNNDSEILLHLIEEVYDGDLLKTVQSTVKMLNGMYVLAVTDGKKIIIARDPIGIKPVYYSIKDEVVYFSSEKKAIWEFGTPKRILPGRILELNENGAQIHTGVMVERPQIDINDFNHAVYLYENALVNSVNTRVRGLTQAKLGMIFSGGVDSVLIAKILTELGCDLTCYCVGMKGSQDVENAQKVAKDLQFDHKTIIIDRETIGSILPDIIECIEINGLLQVKVAVPMYLSAKAASEDGIKVMFTGQAADELFAGYTWYRTVVENDGFLTLHEKLWEDIDLLYDDTLEREDKVTMAHSVEMRVPYLDREVVKIAMRMFPTLKIKSSDDTMRKWVHRKVAEKHQIPSYIAYRNKDSAQSGSGIHDLIREVAQNYFEDKKVKYVEIEDKGSIYRYLDEEYGTPEMWAYMNEISQGLNLSC
ncbi:MAG: asparagine synthetase B [Methanosarcinales archaeon]|nr:asparagine synthetase B [Methanosarcinales archaeon]